MRHDDKGEFWEAAGREGHGGFKLLGGRGRGRGGILENGCCSLTCAEAVTFALPPGAEKDLPRRSSRRGSTVTSASRPSSHGKE